MPGTRRQAERMQARRSPAIVAAIAALLLVATAAASPTIVPPPTTGPTAEALRALPAVTSVDGPHLTADEAHDEDAHATAFTVALDEERRCGRRSARPGARPSRSSTTTAIPTVHRS